MRETQLLKLFLGLTSGVILILTILLIFAYVKRRRSKQHEGSNDIESKEENKHEEGLEEMCTENLVTFNGGEDLTISDVLDAPGEVIGKSNYGTLYKAMLQRSNTVTLLRFLRPVCTEKVEVFDDLVELLGKIRHPNLAPLLGYYAGSKGEKLLVYPFYRHGNLAQFIKGRTGESYKWTQVYNISLGIAKGLDHLHTGLDKPLVHGNLKSKNIHLDRNYEPYISDYGLHLVLSPTAGQDMFEALSSQGYKAPELIKMKDVNEKTDIYSFGVILLELLARKEAINENTNFYLTTFIRNAVLDNRISDLYHSDLLLSDDSESGVVRVSEERILRLFQLAMACCSPSRSLRPNTKDVLKKLGEI